MVQITQYPGRGTTDRRNQYWKISAEYPISESDALSMMMKNHWFCLLTHSASKIREQHTRMNRGLLSYEGCSVDERMRFVKDRQLATSVGKRKKKLLVPMSEHGDDNATFRFISLPAEIRNIVFSLLLNSYNLPECPVQPPISRVFRLLRQESLSLFYATCTFEIAILGVFRSGRQRRAVEMDPDLEESVKRGTYTGLNFAKSPGGSRNQLTAVTNRLKQIWEAIEGEPERPNLDRQDVFDLRNAICGCDDGF